MKSDDTIIILLAKIGTDISQMYALLARVGYDSNVINNEEYRIILDSVDREFTAYAQIMDALGQEIDKDSLS